MHPQDNIMVALSDLSNCSMALSDTWVVAGWSLRFVQLAPHEIWEISPGADEQPALKLLNGSLLDIGYDGVLRDDGRWESFTVTTPYQARSLHLNNRLRRIQAGAHGAVFAFFVIPLSLLSTPLTSFAEGPAANISGPFSNLLQWVNILGDQGEWYNLAGFVVNSHHGKRLATLQWWADREVEDIAHDKFHNGKRNVDTKLHYFLYASSANSGIKVNLPTASDSHSRAYSDQVLYDKGADRKPQVLIALPPGFIHGPFWLVNASNGQAMVDHDGYVMYSYHRMISGMTSNDTFHKPARYNVWGEVDQPPEFMTLPSQMLDHWTQWTDA